MDMCLYHKNCADGFGAAWAVRRRFGDIEFRAVQYGDSVPDVTDKDVIIVDFSFPQDVLLEILNHAKSLVVIDHHKTAQESLVGLDFCVFDMNKSGCVLTWEYLFDEPPPELFLYLQDRDLWRWELPHSREVSAALRSYPTSFDVWDGLVENPETLKTEGAAILRYQRQQIDANLAQKIDTVEIGGYSVPCVNCTHLISELGNELAKGKPFAALYFDTGDGKRVFSLRSTDEGVDVSEIAKMYGGGGHRNAAGFTIKRPDDIIPASQ